ncbi:MAG: 3-carboxy-cis,cis-muconate cycloisomerase, partial [Planktomarina sp.]|nr:3-carboxy-cis,cis-muconate cycloisomerase [Planktomarina sp.]|tara:strand:- start:239 stop:439 length:201 start_codon:yes stop_codon:yes gene_type:complete
MSEVFRHPWLSGAFGDAEVSSYLTPEVQLSNMLRIEAAQSRILGNEDAVKAIKNAKIKPSDPESPI